MSLQGRDRVFVLVVASVVPVLFSSGCGGDEVRRAAVTGAVWVDGQPLKEGSITFIPTGETKGPKVSAKIKDGFYELPKESGPVVGTVRVEIRDAVDPGFNLDDPEAFTRHGNKPLPGPKIPAEYHDRSKITRSVSSEEINKFDFQIETNVKKRRK